MRELLIGEPEMLPVCPIAEASGNRCGEPATMDIEVVAPSGTKWLMPICPEHFREYGMPALTPSSATEES